MAVLAHLVRSPGRQRRAPEAFYRSAFGARVRALREECGLSQQSLADAVDMSARYLGSIERGQANVTLDVIVRLADGMDVEPGSLLPSRAR